MINNLESYNKAQLIELVKTQIEEYQKLDKALRHSEKCGSESTITLSNKIAELEKENLKLKKFSSFQSEVVTNSEVEIAELEQNLGLIKLGIEQQHKQLISCETALAERDHTIKNLREEIKNYRGQSRNPDDINAIAELEKVLTKLNNIGGLGLDKHKWIEQALKGGAK